MLEGLQSVVLALPQFSNRPQPEFWQSLPVLVLNQLPALRWALLLDAGMDKTLRLCNLFEVSMCCITDRAWYLEGESIEPTVFGVEETTDLLLLGEPGPGNLMLFFRHFCHTWLPSEAVSRGYIDGEDLRRDGSGFELPRCVSKFNSFPSHRRYLLHKPSRDTCTIHKQSPYTKTCMLHSWRVSKSQFVEMSLLRHSEVEVGLRLQPICSRTPHIWTYQRLLQTCDDNDDTPPGLLSTWLMWLIPTLTCRTCLTRTQQRPLGSPRSLLRTSHTHSVTYSSGRFRTICNLGPRRSPFHVIAEKWILKLAEITNSSSSSRCGRKQNNISGVSPQSHHLRVHNEHPVWPLGAHENQLDVIAGEKCLREGGSSQNADRCESSHGRIASSANNKHKQIALSRAN